MHSFILVRHGQVVAQGWWDPFDATEPHQLFSLSKSFTSIAVGIAISEGKISIDDTVLSFFPDKAPKDASKNLQGLRVRDLLSMSTGHHEEEIKDFPFGGEEDLVAKFFALPLAHKPGTHFMYNTPATYMLSAIVQKVTGQTLLEYLKPRLFEPLGIENPTWDMSSQGVCFGGFGLNLRTGDIAKFGQLLLQRGQWSGRQLVPAAWIDEATARQTSNGSAPDSDWDQGYGYQFWRCRHGFYRGDGAFGQFCIVMPQYDAVLAVTSGTRDMGKVMSLAWEHLIPAFSDKALPADPAALGKLKEKLAHLRLPLPKNSGTPSAAYSGITYTFQPNPAQLEKLTLLPGATAQRMKFRLLMGGKEQILECGFGEWVQSNFILQGQTDSVAAAAAWTSPDTFTVYLYPRRGPVRLTCEFRFQPDKLTIDGVVNVNDEKFQLVGTTSVPPTPTM